MNRRDIDRILESELRRPVGSPDLTRSIMGRLGYMQASPVVVRRKKLQRWLGRLSLVCVSGVVGWVGVIAYQSSPEARRPFVDTMPSAIHSDLQYQQHHFNSVIQMLREMPPRIEFNDADDAHMPHVDEDVDRSAVAPVRWV